MRQGNAAPLVDNEQMDLNTAANGIFFFYHILQIKQKLKLMSIILYETHIVIQ